MPQTLTVTSAFGQYTVTFVHNLEGIPSLLRGRPIHYIIDNEVWKVYKKRIPFINYGVSLYRCIPLERYKTISSVTKYINFLLAHDIQKNHVVVVLGGGLVQDIGSFTAHILKRGITWVFVPTTLLAMADSCVGSKSGINVGKYKNQVGAFHPPSEIYIYPFFLQTLPSSDIQNGNGEIIKHAILKGGKVFEYLTNELLSVPSDLIKTQEIIYQSLLVKKEIVEEDEFEKGRRKLLNYGHTFGHALEGYTKNRISHGIAVTIGMDMSNFISMRRGILNEREFQKLSRLLHKNIPYRNLSVRKLDVYMDFLSHDKKVIGNEVNALLCRGVGKVEIIKIKLDHRFTNDIATYVSSFQKLHQQALS